MRGVPVFDSNCGKHGGQSEESARHGFVVGLPSLGFPCSDQIVSEAAPHFIATERRTEGQCSGSNARWSCRNQTRRTEHVCIADRLKTEISLQFARCGSQSHGQGARKCCRCFANQDLTSNEGGFTVRQIHVESRQCDRRSESCRSAGTNGKCVA